MAIDIAAVDAAVLNVVGEALTYTPFGGSATPVTGLFQEPDIRPESLTVEFTTSGPIAFVNRSDAPTPSKQDLLTRDATGQAYQVKDFELDEGAITVLDLEEI